ncbi:hypothetical protein ACK3TF_004874 [Chlorella vulgaris]
MGTQKYVGANQVMEETQALFLDSRYGVKASQALGRILKTLVCAMEFIHMPTPPLPHFDKEVLRKLARKKVEMLPGDRIASEQQVLALLCFEELVIRLNDADNLPNMQASASLQ